MLAEARPIVDISVEMHARRLLPGRAVFHRSGGPNIGNQGIG
jgi:hypothetical protein